MNILIVEDEVIAASYLKQIITQEGFNVIGMVGTGKGAIELTKLTKPNLILMDIMLEDNISGIDAAIEIHKFHKDIIIIFMTAYSDKEMIASSIEANAYSYFLKPYNKEEILANLHIIESKINPKESEVKIIESPILLTHGYTYHMTYNQLYLHQKEVYLSQRELQLLRYFCKHRHVVLNFDEIINYIWDTPKSQQTLRSLIHRIRVKTCQELVLNINKMGYKINLKD